MATNIAPNVDPAIWRACAGKSVDIPPVGSMVYYFIQGHAEQVVPTSTHCPTLESFQPTILCRVLSVKYLADPITDEVFASLRLVPASSNSNPTPELNSDGEDVNTVVSFTKILTPSDANNGGGFSVPRFCADSVYPALDYDEDPPMQTLVFKDVRGALWEFRHIYRGTPRRHLLTTGWSKFVNSKRMIARDSVVFMRNERTGELSIGIRRVVKPNGDSSARWQCLVEDNGASRGTEVASNYGKRTVSLESVAEAAKLAAQGLAFEVLCYPQVGWTDFVVKAEIVDLSMNVPWTAGMKVKMGMETEDSSRMTWFQGTVSSVGVPENGPWRGSPWRMLQVTWDEPEVLQNVKRVNPWQVECIMPTAPMFSPFPPTKRQRINQNPEFLPSGGGEFIFPMMELSHSMMGQLSPSLMNYTSFPAGMQGARQNQTSLSSSFGVLSENTQLQICTDDRSGNQMSSRSNAVCTDLSIGSSQSDSLSPGSQGSVHFTSTDSGGRRGCNSSQIVAATTFQLFGTHVCSPTESCTGY
uniref:Auxin response factor n=1 Tax=Eucommia ulmoides TaxID=4392 RepID=A0A649UJG2_EUCUL|nr:ARF17 [Eucommia ulmoides]